MSKNSYHRHRFPPEIISHCIWLYNSFSLSLRDIEKMMLYRGIEVTYETIRDWNNKFAQGHLSTHSTEAAQIACFGYQSDYEQENVKLERDNWG